MKKKVTLTLSPTETPKKARNKETTAAGKIGDWQRLLAPLVANADDLRHLEIPRTQLADMVAQAADLKKRQAAQRAAKQEASKQLQEMIVEGVRLANLLRQAVRQHYGIRSEKLVEFGIQPFRGRTPAPAPTTPSDPPPPVEVGETSPTPASR